MRRGQTRIPSEWLVVDARLGDGLWPAVRKLPRDSGILVLRHELSRCQRHELLRDLRRVASGRRLVVVEEALGRSARVHNIREFRSARLSRASLLFLSPIYPTRSHPDWRPLRRMRAAALIRLASRPVIALGGMNRRRFRSIRKLGFAGWAGIDAWRV